MHKLFSHPASWPALLGAAVFLGFFYNIGSVPLFDLDEGIYSEATREMLARGDFITPYVNGEPFYEKPILLYWAQAAAVGLFGVTEFAFRLPSALAASAWVLAVFFFTRRRWDRETAFAAAIMNATAIGVSVIGHAAITDALLGLFVGLSMLDIYRYYEDPRRRYAWLAFLWIGLGLLTKGPIAAVIPLMASAIFFYWQKQMRLWRRAAIDPVGWLITLGVAAPWFVAEYLREGQAFIDGFFLRHNLERFGSAMEGHGGNLLYYFYYLPMAFLLVLPFAGLLIRILPRLRQAPAKPLELYLWIWFFVVLVFFSIAGTKLPHYLVIGLTPLFILMAVYRDSLRSRWLAFLPPVLFLLLVLALPRIASLARARGGDEYVQAMLGRADEVFGSGFYIAVAVSLALVVVLALWPRVALWKRLLLTGLVCAFATSQAVIPALAGLQQQPVKEAALIARGLKETVVMSGLKMPSFSVYRGAVTPRRRPRPGEVVFTRVDKMKRYGPHEVIFQKGGVALLRLPPAGSE